MPGPTKARQTYLAAIQAELAKHGHPQPNPQMAMQQLAANWSGLRRQFPGVTRGVRTDFTNTLPSEGRTYQRGLNQHGRPLIQMDPVQAAELPDATNEYALAHELGHANEPRFVTDAQRAGAYNALRGPAPGRGRGVVLTDQWGLARTAAKGDTPANELYAADFAGALGRKWPNGKQASPAIMRELARLGVMPRPTKRGR